MKNHLGRTTMQRWADMVTITETCWLWTGYRSKKGYGQITIARTQVPVHRFIYELVIGPIPKGLQIDHVKSRGCLNRHCCNPDHLEAVTPVENIRRGDVGANMRTRTHCPQGHPLSGSNLVMGKQHRSGGPMRRCRTCINASSLRSKRKAQLPKEPQHGSRDHRPIRDAEWAT